jgi:hypothetical protein
LATAQVFLVFNFICKKRNLMWSFQGVTCIQFKKYHYYNKYVIRNRTAHSGRRSRWTYYRRPWNFFFHVDVQKTL